MVVEINIHREYKMKRLLIILCLFFATTLVAQDYIHLTWFENSEPDLAGYKVYYGINPGVYSNTVDVKLQDWALFDYNNFSKFQNYYFAVTAYDSTGNESNFSTEVLLQAAVQDTIPPVPPLLKDIKKLKIK